MRRLAAFVEHHAGMIQLTRVWKQMAIAEHANFSVLFNGFNQPFEPAWCYERVVIQQTNVFATRLVGGEVHIVAEALPNLVADNMYLFAKARQIGWRFIGGTIVDNQKFRRNARVGMLQE